MSESPNTWRTPEFDWPDGNGAREWARDHFLAAVVRYKPQALQDLADGPLRLYLETGKPGNPLAMEFLRDRIKEGARPREDGSQIDRFFAALDTWATRWRLDNWKDRDPWIFLVAFETINFWLEYPQQAGRGWMGAGAEEGAIHPFSPELPRFQLSISEGVDPLSIDLGDYREKLLANVEEHFANFARIVRTSAHDKGLVRFGTRPGYPDLIPIADKQKPVRFDWLVQYQLGKSGNLSAIARLELMKDRAAGKETKGMKRAKGEKRSEWRQRTVATRQKAVSDAVKVAAALVGITLRPSRVGRPVRS